MAPSGARRSPSACLLLWLIAALRWAGTRHSVTARADTQCVSLDDGFAAALNSTMPQPNLTLGAGCYILTRNFVCTPIKSPLSIIGSEESISTWDVDFDLYQFSVEPGVVVTLRNLVLSRALVFTAVDSSLQPSSIGSLALQPSIFHMREESRLVLQNVTVQTRCKTLTYYWNLPDIVRPEAALPQPLAPLALNNLTIGAVTLVNVTISCDEDLEPSGSNDLYVHTMPAFGAFLTAASTLSIGSTIHLMENFTLPYVSPASYSAEAADQRQGLVTADTVITGDPNAVITYLDSNFTAAWLTIQVPARLTLRRLVLTRLHATIVAPGGSNGLLAGALPVSMLHVTGIAPQQTRFLEDVTLVVPQYEVTEMAYWCIMVSVGTPELKSAADFLRAYVWYSDFDVLDSTRLYLKRIRTATSTFTRVLLTSQPPSGVPFDDSGPPADVVAYQHVQPPLYIVTTGQDWADAVAPVLPQDICSSPLPTGGSSAAAGGSLPTVVLINGTVTLQHSHVQVARSSCGSGSGSRVVRRNVVVTSMRQGCSSADPSCPPAILDMGGLTEAIRLGSPNITVVLMGITLRNVTPKFSGRSSSGGNAANLSSLGNFFVFDRSSVQISFERVTVELRSEAFAALHGLVSRNPRAGGMEELIVISLSDDLIQLASFQFAGARGSLVNFTIGDGTGYDGAVIQPDVGVQRSVVAVIVGAAVGGGCALLLAVGVVVWWLARSRRRRLGTRGCSKDDATVGSVDDKYGGSPSFSRSVRADLSMEGSGASTLNTFGNVHLPSGVGSAAITAAAAEAAAAVSTDPGSACNCKKISDEESPQCTTLTFSDLNSSETATPPLQAVPPMAMVPLPPPVLQLAVVGTSGQMARGAFSVARSVPEEVELGAEVSIDSSARGDESGCSTSVGAVGRHLLSEDAAVAAAAAAAGTPGDGGTRAVARILPSLLDPPADAPGRGSGGGCSSAPARRAMRLLSGGRAHLYGIGDCGRSSGLRVRAALGRSPSRPARSAASSSGGPSMTLPAPQAAVLAAPASPRAMAPTAVATAPPAFAIGARYHYQGQHLRNGGGQRREPSNPTLVASASGGGGGGGGGGVSIVSGGCAELGFSEVTPSHSTQLTATGGTLDPLLGPALDGESISPGLSASISKVPEPASEVQRLIQELSTHGADQLVILEPIGQGGYGMVYRGVWRNLDVAVKTVLFQDRANLAQPQLSCPVSACTPPSTSQMVQTSVIQEGEEGGQKLLGPNSGAGVSWTGASVSGTFGQCGGGGGGGTHNWALASQQAANSGSLPSVNVGGGVTGTGTGAGGPLGVASQQRAVLEAAVSCSVTHPNVVATYHYDITPIRPSAVVCSGGLLVSDGNYMRGGGGGCGGCGGSLTLAGGMLGGAGAVSDWKLYLVQEFCDAGSLANALDARAFHDPAGMPNLALSLCTLADIARGMAHIHSRSIVHGDLNPTNILLRSVSGSNSGILPMWNRVGMMAGGNGTTAAAAGGGNGSATPGGGSVSAAAQLRQELGVILVAKVADFGLCGMLAPGKRHISNALRGTPFYTAPETVATGTLTKASDVYSFGVIAWEVYTGRPPFQHLPDQGFVRDENFPRLPPHVPATFANMTLACISADPDARPTFDQILDRLMSLQSKLVISLQQRLSRLMVNGGAFLSAASPHGHGTVMAASSTPFGATMPTAGLGEGAGGVE